MRIHHDLNNWLVIKKLIFNLLNQITIRILIIKQQEIHIDILKQKKIITKKSINHLKNSINLNIIINNLKQKNLKSNKFLKEKLHKDLICILVLNKIRIKQNLKVLFNINNIDQQFQ